MVCSTCEYFSLASTRLCYRCWTSNHLVHMNWSQSLQNQFIFLSCSFHIIFSFSFLRISTPSMISFNILASLKSPVLISALQCEHLLSIFICSRAQSRHQTLPHHDIVTALCKTGISNQIGHSAILLIKAISSLVIVPSISSLNSFLSCSMLSGVTFWPISIFHRRFILYCLQ
ncbi:unnamed protein product [Moneuplotes crassus]|uniref:Uncharacterized protein n=1 Tax=Euplotes crassus TaxID=5936 RepID=A0AAD1UBQ2_EUPCR|nr:unnamed protein product [Moneuplotes crassus]